MKPPGFEPRLALGYAAFFAIQGVYLPFFPLWLRGEGLDASQIAFVVAVPALVRVAAIMPLTALADRSQERADLTILFWFAAALALSAHLLAFDFTTVALAHAVLAVLWLPQLPILDALALSGVRRFGTDYGRVRLWGSIAFLLANLAGGWAFADAPSDAVLWTLVAGFWLAAGLALTTPRLGPARTANVDAGGTSLVVFMRRRPFALVMLGAGLVQAAHAFSYGFVTIYWVDRGWSEGTVGALWAVSVLAEVALFQFAGPALRRFGPAVVLLAGGAGAVLRWVLFPLEPGVAGTVGLQVMHALSFGATHLGQQLYIARHVEAHEATAAQGFATLLAGITMGLAGLASGRLYAQFGVDGFLAMSGLAALGTGVLLAGLRLQVRRATL